MGTRGKDRIGQSQSIQVRNFMVSEGLTVLSRTYRPAKAGAYCFDAPGETEQEQIAKTTDPDAKRKRQLNFMRTRGGREFVEIVEAFLKTPGLTVGDVTDVNKLVNDAYINLVNEYFDAILGTVAYTAKPFVELALFNSMSDVALKGLTAVLNSKWGVDLYNSVKGLKAAKITQITYETISTSKKLIEFRVGMKRAEFFMANMEKAAKPTKWIDTQTSGVFTMEFKGLKYSVRPFSKSAGSTVEVFKNGKKIAKYRLMD